MIKGRRDSVQQFPDRPLVCYVFPATRPNSMRHIFYQGNFCAHCGNELRARSWWRPRYLCADCERHLRRFRLATPLLLALGILMISMPIRKMYPPLPPPPVSALDATAKQKPVYRLEEEERVFCGALTKKGTPCRRLVRPGERCAQHRELKRKGTPRN